MYPRSFKVFDGVEVFFYNKGEYRRWKRRGEKHGDVGMLLWKRDGKVIIYKGFGTIENPNTSMSEFSMIHNPLFDGKWLDAKDIIKTKEQEKIDSEKWWKENKDNYKLYILDASDYDGNPNFKRIE